MRRRVALLWRQFALKMLYVLEKMDRVLRTKAIEEELNYRMPMLARMAANEMVTEIDYYTPASYPVSRPTSTRFPEKIKDCEHHRADQYIYGNKSGRYRDCRNCGMAWKGVPRTLPTTNEEIVMYDEVRGFRPTPGSKVQPIKDKPAPERTGYPSSSHSSSRQSQRRSEAAPRTTTRPSRTASSRPATSTPQEENDVDWMEEDGAQELTPSPSESSLSSENFGVVSRRRSEA